MDLQIVAMFGLILVVRIVLPFFVARWAESRGWSFAPWFLAGVIVGPLLTGLVLFLLPSDRAPTRPSRIVDFGAPAAKA